MYPQKNTTWLGAHRKLVFLALGIVLAGVSVSIAASTRNKTTEQGTLCLTASDYTDLTGNTTEDTLTPSNNFYTQTFDFTDSTTYSDSASKDSINNFGVFYKAHPTKSILFTVSSDYTDESGSSAAEKRIAHVVSDLRASGVPEVAILTPSPTLLENTESTSVSFATIAISSSDAACQE